MSTEDFYSVGVDHDEFEEPLRKPNTRFKPTLEHCEFVVSRWDNRYKLNIDFQIMDSKIKIVATRGRWRSFYWMDKYSSSSSKVFLALESFAAQYEVYTNE